VKRLNEFAVVLIFFVIALGSLVVGVQIGIRHGRTLENKDYQEIGKALGVGEGYIDVWLAAEKIKMLRQELAYQERERLNAETLLASALEINAQKKERGK